MGTVIQAVAASRNNSRLDQLILEENFDSDSISKPENNSINNSSDSNFLHSTSIELGTSVFDSKELQLEPRKLVRKKLATPYIYSKRLIKIGKLYKNIQHSISKEKQVCFAPILTLF